MREGQRSDSSMENPFQFNEPAKGIDQNPSLERNHLSTVRLVAYLDLFHCGLTFGILLIF
jgi:hypothetical protein